MTGDKVPYWEYDLTERRYKELFGMYPMEHLERMGTAAEKHGIPIEEITALHDSMLNLAWETLVNDHEREQEEGRIRQENGGFLPLREGDDIPFQEG